jgi:hypothetical protein
VIIQLVSGRQQTKGGPSLKEVIESRDQKQFFGV